MSDVVERSCTGKVRHDDGRSARAHAVSLRHDRGGRYRAYRCALCSGWHVGRPPTMETLRQLARAIRGLEPAP